MRKLKGISLVVQLVAEISLLVTSMVSLRKQREGDGRERRLSSQSFVIDLSFVILLPIIFIFCTLLPICLPIMYKLGCSILLAIHMNSCDFYMWCRCKFAFKKILCQRL